VLLMMIRLRSVKIILLISAIYGILTAEDIKVAVKKVLKEEQLEHTIINPLFGYMFRVNGCLESIRFYSSDLVIKYEDTGERNYSQDKSEDSLTNLLIQLFPSHTGTFNNLIRLNTNFTNKYFVENKAYNNKKEKNRIANIEMLGITFASLVKRQDNKNIETIDKKTENLYKLFEYYVLSPSTIPGLDNKILKLLVIHEYAVITLNTTYELEAYLNSIIVNLKGRKNAIIHLDLTKEQGKLFKRLYTNPFKFPYSKINPPVSNSSIFIYDRKSNTYKKDQTFSDCADIAILHLCNCLFYNELAGECSLDHLKLTETNRLKKFFEKYHYRPFGVTQEMRNDWSRVVQGLDDNRAFECQGNFKPYIIHYCKQGYRNEIRSGPLNILSVLANICGVNEEFKEIMTKGKISKDSVVEKITEFFNEISNESVKVTIKGCGIEEVAYNNINDFIGDFYMTLYLKPSTTSVTMKLRFSKGHTSFFFEDMKSEQKEYDFAALKSRVSHNGNYILSLLINRYIGLLNNNDAKTEIFDYPFEVLYNKGALHTNEQKRDQCIYLCKYMERIGKEECMIVKKIIENVVQSANLSDPATREMFLPFFIFSINLLKEISNDKKFELWLSLHSKFSAIQSQTLENAWNEAIKHIPIKIKQMSLSDSNYTISKATIILSFVKNTLEAIILSINFARDSQEFSKMIKELLVDNFVLKTLSISGKALDLEGMSDLFKMLENNATLTTLDISYASLRNEDIKRLSDALIGKKTCLSTLNISNNYFQADGAKYILQILKNNTTLVSLNISNNSLGVEGAKFIADALKENHTLKTLDLSNTKLQSEGIKIIVDALEINTSLRNLYAFSNDIRAQGAKYISEALERNIFLTSLDISENNIRGDDFKPIAEALIINTNLKELNVSGNFLEFEGAKYIADALKRNIALTYLDISNCRYLESEGVKYITDALKENFTLTHLNISKNDLEAKSAEYFADALKCNISLVALNISMNSLDTAGATYIADALKNNSNLTTLNISGILLRNKGAESIANALKQNKNLINLDISQNLLNDCGIEEIANALIKNEVLKYLNIKNNVFGLAGSKILAQALKQNKCLLKLCINDFRLGSQVVEQMSCALKENTSLEVLDLSFNEDKDIHICKKYLNDAIENNSSLKRLILREPRRKINCIIILSRLFDLEHSRVFSFEYFSFLVFFLVS